MGGEIPGTASTHPSSTPTHYLNHCLLIVNWTLGANFSEIRIKIHIVIHNCIGKCRLRNGGHFVEGDELTWFIWDMIMLNTLRPTQNGRHFADDIFKCIFSNENKSISINISLKFVPQGRINNIPALVQILAWRRPGDKPLSEPMMVSLLTHICVTRPQWLK